MSHRSGLFLSIGLLFCFSGGVAQAAPAFKPSSPDFVVLQLPASAGRDVARSEALEETRAKIDPKAAQALAARLIQRARDEREPRFFGRAEALLQPWTAKPDAPAEMLLLHADILQNRHDFQSALTLLDRAVSADPQDVRGRLMRATVLMVRGKPQQARSDCAAIFSSGESTVGSVCLAQVLAAQGQLEHAADLVRVVSQNPALAPDVKAWSLATLADIAARKGDPVAAEQHLRAALSAVPNDETLRIALCDLLLARRDAREALPLLDLPRPTIGILVRRLFAESIARDPKRPATLAQLQELLDLEARRSERVHLREEALLALGTGQSPATVLQLARQNFALQREAIDVRLFARAAADAHDRTAMAEVKSWRAETGFKDRLVDSLLAEFPG